MLIKSNKYWITGNSKNNNRCFRINNDGNDISSDLDFVLSLLTNILGTYGEDKTHKNLGKRGGFWYTLFTGADYGSTLYQILEKASTIREKEVEIETELNRISRLMMENSVVERIEFKNYYFGLNILTFDVDIMIRGASCLTNYTIRI